MRLIVMRALMSPMTLSILSMLVAVHAAPCRDYLRPVHPFDGISKDFTYMSLNKS